jgi:uncharacterized protein
MTESTRPQPLFVLFYDSADDVYESAPRHFAAHRARLDEFRDRAELLLVGTFADPRRDGSMAIFRTQEGAEDFARGDPFVLNGVVVRWRVLQWNEAFGI